METNLPTVLVEALMIGIYTDNLECLLLDDAAAFNTHIESNLDSNQPDSRKYIATKKTFSVFCEIRGDSVSN